MKNANFTSTTCWLLLLAPFFFNTFVHSGFAPVEWSPEILPPQQCGLEITHDLSDALETVAQLVKSNDTASSLPKSCTEIKESSPVSPSGYYTISNGNGGSVVVYCNMDQLYSCPSLEQTLKGFSSTLSGFTNTVTGVSSTMTEVASTVTGISNSLEANSASEKIPTSCQEVWDSCPNCTSGNYKIFVADLIEKYVYCEERWDIPGAWRRVAYLNMSDSSSVCPSGTQKFEQGSAIACGIQEPNGPKCAQISTSITNSYSQICGRVAGYQKGTPDAFFISPSHLYSINLDGHYVDGVSITRGSPRKHVWAYAIGQIQENPTYDSNLLCPFGPASTQQVPSFVGSDYYYESGNTGGPSDPTIYSNDVLWDGEQCGPLETGCCSSTDQPWFHKVIDDGPSNDNMEIRLCVDEGTSNENVLVSSYEIYVK